MKNQFQQAKDLGLPIKTNLYEHLTEVFNRLNLHYQVDGFDRFEEISGLVKKNNFKLGTTKSDKDVNDAAMAATEVIGMISKAQALLRNKR